MEIKHLLLYLFIIIVPFIIKLSAQNNTYTGEFSEATSSSIMLNLENTRYRLYKSLSDSNQSDIISLDMLHQGSLIKEKNDIRCFDEKSRKTYHLKIISDEKILNVDMPFLPVDTLYIIRKNLPDGAKYFGRWKNRNKDGTWYFYPKKGDPYWILYKEGMVLFAMKILI